MDLSEFRTGMNKERLEQQGGGSRTKAGSVRPKAEKKKVTPPFWWRKWSVMRLARLPMLEPSQVQLTVSETNEREPEDNSTGRRTSGRVRKRTQVDGRCECDTEIIADEKEEGTRVMSMRCKARGCETGWVRAIHQMISRVLNFWWLLMYSFNTTCMHYLVTALVANIIPQSSVDRRLLM